jgi:hypothetical protein
MLPARTTAVTPLYRGGHNLGAPVGRAASRIST